MRATLVDNSTLSGVQRILGNIETNSKNTIDGDILCLESLIRNILFSDSVYYLDDYKKEYRAERNSFFNELRPYNLIPTNYEKIINQAEKQKNDFFPVVIGGEITDETFRPFLDMLKMNIIFNWKKSQSEWYLNLCMLQGRGEGTEDIARYSKISDMIFGELFSGLKTTDRGPKKKYILKDSNGRHIDDKYKLQHSEGIEEDPKIHKQARIFLSSLNWLAHRSLVYMLISNHNGMILSLHPIRDSFALNYLQKSSGYSDQLTNQLILQLSKDSKDTLEQIYNQPNGMIVRQDVPLFSAWMASKGFSPDNYIEKALELSKTKEFTQARNHLSELEEIKSNSDFTRQTRETTKLIQVLNEDYSDILYKFNIKSSQGPISSPLIKTWNYGSSLIDTFKLPAIEMLRPLMNKTPLDDWIPRRGLRHVFRNLTYDLAKVGKLGEYHELITSNLVKSSRYYSGQSATEKEEMRYARSHWKTPM